ncbi:ATP-binding protein [Thermococcus sp.]|uniref:ATP-binding protein n=1 Tax=Thermococcus sp. TaxID=35749 RepID=UPI002615A478|nr:ATP-binding protein [Thermococcus sp.]
MEMFVNRRRELRVLEGALNALGKGEKFNVAVIGPRRIGKTELLLKFKETHEEGAGCVIPYLNVQRTGSVESFKFAYLRELLYEAAKKRGFDAERSKLVDWDGLLVLGAKLGVDGEVTAIKRGSIGELFELQEEILKKLDLKAIFILDEFQDTVRFPNFLEIMRSTVEKQKAVAYIISGSAVRMMEKILSPKKPFFGQFRRLYLGGLPKEDSIELAKAMLSGVKVSNAALELIHRLTGGNPFYISAVCRRLTEEGFERVGSREVYVAFLTELLSESGDIYSHLDYVFNESLSRAYKGAVHREILLILAREEGLTLSEISERLGKPSGEVSNYMKFLLRTDLITKENNRYYFTDKLMRFWLGKTYLGITELELRREKLLRELIGELEEKYLKARTELGKAVEFMVREELGKRFGVKFEPYRRGDVEFDGVAFGERTYVLEIKWRNRPVGAKDVEKFARRAKSEFGEPVMVMFSRSGFTEKAREVAERLGVVLVGDKML